MIHYSISANDMNNSQINLHWYSYYVSQQISTFFLFPHFVNPATRQGVQGVQKWLQEMRDRIT